MWRLLLVLGVVCRLSVAQMDPSAMMGLFNYRDQDMWPGVCTTGKAQSPVYIDSRAKLDPKLRRLKISNFDEEYPTTVINIGSGLIFIPYPNFSGLPAVTGGAEKSYRGRYKKYRLEFCFLHWGDSITFGSDHRIGDHQYAGEIQCYSYDEDKYDDVFDAAASRDKDAVVGTAWLLKPTSGSGNPSWDGLCDLLPSIAMAGNNVTIPDFKPTDYIPKSKDYFHYQGSFPFPVPGVADGCTEVVSWYIFKDTIPLTMSQYEKLLTIEDGTGMDMIQTFRYPQKLNYRKVRAYKYRGSHKSGKGYRGYGPSYKRRGPGYKSRGYRRGPKPYGPKPYGGRGKYPRGPW